MGLCFSTGIRLFAVGDTDQSIYGFTGANPELLREVSQRADVETVHLRFNYRSGKRIVVASEDALGEERGYTAPDGAQDGTIFFHPRNGTYQQQADYLFSKALPAAFNRMPEMTLGDIAILYPAAWIGDAVSQSAQEHGYGILRTDTNSLYPRSSRIMRWLERCAIWSCSGWRTGIPRFSRLVGEGSSIFAEVITEGDQRRIFQRQLLALLWARRDSKLRLHAWLSDIHDGLLQEMIAGSRSRTKRMRRLQLSSSGPPMAKNTQSTI